MLGVLCWTGGGGTQAWFMGIFPFEGGKGKKVGKEFRVGFFFISLFVYWKIFKLLFDKSTFIFFEGSLYTYFG